MSPSVGFTLNGKPVKCEVKPETTLLHLLRNTFGLTGTKEGCGSGTCGTCSVWVDNQLVKSCQTKAVEVDGASVTTIEGLAEDGRLTDLQEAFVRHGAVQCGYCIPAMIMAGEALLREKPLPTRHEIRKAINSVLCRCTGYQQIVDAIEETAYRRQNLPWLPPSPVIEPSPQSPYRYIHQLDAKPVDGYEKVTGRARYVGDLRVPGMLYARLLLSPLPHARIVRLNPAPALEVEGVKAVITSKDFVDNGQFGWPVRDAFILAYQKVRYVGDPIAAVAAETEEAAKKGVEAIEVEFEPLEVVTDVHQALKPETVIIPENAGKGSNLCVTHIVRNGDAEAILSECAHVVEHRFEFAPQEHVYLETEGALAIPEPDGGVTIYANDQSPFINRENTAAVLGLPSNLVRVIQPPVGGSFGGKDDIGYQLSAQAAKLALITGRPVRIVLSRKESLLASYKREGMEIHLKVGTDAKGRLRAAQAQIWADSGAYASMTPLSSWRATMHVAGCYLYEAAKVDTYVVYTNNGYAGAFRGFGNPQACAASEILIDDLAHRFGEDPIEYRLRNLIVQGKPAFTGNILRHPVHIAECLRWVRERSDWNAKRAEYARQPSDQFIRRGIGVACYFHGTGLGGEGKDYASARIHIESDHTIVINHGLTDYGQGSRTVFTLLAAEVLQVSPERIRMPRPDTQTAAEPGPTVASRATIVGGNAVRVAAQKLVNLLNLAAADLLGCLPEQVQRLDERFLNPRTEEIATFDEVVAHALKMGFQLAVEGYWQIPQIHWDFEKGQGEPYFTYCYGAQVAEVEVNLKAKEIRVLHIWAAHDAGMIVYPEGAKGQMIGAIVQGLGYALTEGFTYKNGYPEKPELNKYTIPRATQVPEIEVHLLSTIQPEGPFGAKGLAEPPIVATAPAIANAVFQATGRRLTRFPLRLE
ncbi:MAG: molybdopterin-dependent oxidoreductase [Anaerolineales bacterium]|nr:molybdopterin-dependent oxidoreductase [Anaerolineales bacterium]MDW8161972.1 molybdopterin cofactor-binding domain-containing protein [Anaerolineales bacterium]